MDGLLLKEVCFAPTGACVGMQTPFFAALSTQKCFSNGPSTPAPAVWSRLLHDERGLKLPYPCPPRPPGASPPPRPPASPSPPTTTTAPSLALAPAAARGQYPVDTPHQKLRSVEFLNENSPPCCPSALPPPWKEKHKSDDWPES